MLLKTHISQMDLWGDYPKDFAISPDGRYVAIKTIADKMPNVFVYRSDGKLITSFVNWQGTECGISFWPDNHHILTTGCGQDGNWDWDGIKWWNLVDATFSLPFKKTPLNHINIDLLGSSPRGRYVIGTQRTGETWCIDTKSNGAILIEGISGHWGSPLLFTSKENRVGLTLGSYLMQRTAKIIEVTSGKCTWDSEKLDESSITDRINLPSKGQVFLCFSPDEQYFITASESSRGVLYIWDLVTFNLIRSYQISESRPRIDSACFSLDGSKLAVSCISYDGYVPSSVVILQPQTFESIDKIRLVNANACLNRVSIMKFNDHGDLVLIENERRNDRVTEAHITVWG